MRNYYEPFGGGARDPYNSAVTSTRTIAQLIERDLERAASEQLIRRALRVAFKNKVNRAYGRYILG